MLDDNLSSDVETTKGASFNDVTGIVGFARIDREGFIIRNTFIFGRGKSRSMNQDRTNLSWSILVNLPDLD